MTVSNVWQSVDKPYFLRHLIGQVCQGVRFHCPPTNTRQLKQEGWDKSIDARTLGLTSDPAVTDPHQLVLGTFVTRHQVVDLWVDTNLLPS